MKKNRLKACFVILSALAVWVSAFFLLCGFSVCLPKGVTVGDYAVGGMPVNSAKIYVRKQLTRQLKSKSLRVILPQQEFVYTYPEISFSDNLDEVMPRAVKGKRGGSYPLAVHAFLNGEDEVISYLCAYVDVPVRQPDVTFCRDGNFVYDSGCDGLHVDREKLKCDIEQSLNGTYVGGNDNFSPVTAKVLRQERTKTLNEVKAGTRLLAQFSTSYDKDNVQRASNIARACAYIGGSVIKRGEEFSFNRTVGKRSRENGFFRAKVIEGGKYVEGFGGGVCQVSTTLYNAALLSGCTVTEYHPHSLSVGYTQPSRDAMVSWGYADMRFVNTTKSTIYIAMRAKNGQVVCSVYGESDGTEYGWESVITSTSDPPDEEKEGVWYTTAKQGLCSEGYLKVIKDGIEERVLIRRDSYAPLRVEGRRQQQNIAPQSEESP